VLQGIAWAGMIAEYSSGSGIVEAARKTFSGEAPCGMCKKIAKAKAKDQPARVAFAALKKTEVAPPLSAVLPKPPLVSDFQYPPSAHVCVVVRSDAPPVPVPRTV